jgi:hypothetical protein
MNAAGMFSAGIFVTDCARWFGYSGWMRVLFVALMARGTAERSVHVLFILSDIMAGSAPESAGVLRHAILGGGACEQQDERGKRNF